MGFWPTMVTFLISPCSSQWKTGNTYLQQEDEGNRHMLMLQYIDMAYNLIHPKFQVQKTHLVAISLVCNCSYKYIAMLHYIMASGVYV